MTKSNVPLLLGVLALAGCIDDVDPDEADVEIEGAITDSALAPGGTLQPDEGLAPADSPQPSAPAPGRY
jgi:hypothetical protein